MMCVVCDDVCEVMYMVVEVVRYARADDCWVIVRGGVYDVMRFVLRYLGGNMIYVKVGGECMVLFDLYYFECVRVMLEKYRIGALRRDAGEREDEDVVEYLKDDLREGEFYVDCKVGVVKYFKDNKFDLCVYWEMYVKMLVILTGVVVGYYGSFFASSVFFVVVLVFVVLYGMCKVEVGVLI